MSNLVRHSESLPCPGGSKSPSVLNKQNLKGVASGVEIVRPNPRTRSLPSIQPNCILQTEQHRAGLMARYGPGKLFQAERNFNAAQDLDVSILEGDLVGIIKQQDPMGSNNRWLIDNGGRSQRLASLSLEETENR